MFMVVIIFGLDSPDEYININTWSGWFFKHSKIENLALDSPAVLKKVSPFTFYMKMLKEKSLIYLVIKKLEPHVFKSLTCRKCPSWCHVKTIIRDKRCLKSENIQQRFELIEFLKNWNMIIYNPNYPSNFDYLLKIQNLILLKWFENYQSTNTYP